MDDHVDPVPLSSPPRVDHRSFVQRGKQRVAAWFKANPARAALTTTLCGLLFAAVTAEVVLQLQQSQHLRRIDNPRAASHSRTDAGALAAVEFVPLLPAAQGMTSGRNFDGQPGTKKEDGGEDKVKGWEKNQLPDCVKQQLHVFESNTSGCMNAWPDTHNCSYWCNEDGYRWLLTNSIPTIPTYPYCPFGVGKGYCMPDGATNCSQFYGMVCPAQDPQVSPDGDVIVPQLITYRFPLNPNPTNATRPLNLYQLNAAYWSASQGGDTHSPFPMQPHPRVLPKNLPHIEQHPPVGYQCIGAHLSGQQLKGPSEAEGFNVDLAGLVFDCGGHITPPIGAGPLWHFHKASTCLGKGNLPSNAHATRQEVEEAGKEEEEVAVDPVMQHSQQQGYANDGFGIYGLHDVGGVAPVVDQCNGHFGPVGLKHDGEQIVRYHYHMQNVTYKSASDQFEPYWIGCLGPSKLRCNDTVSPDYDSGADWCGGGCGYEICVQPGTDSDALNSYIANYGDPNWLDQFTVNPY